MTQIARVPDAPYIREAETVGYPTDDSPLTVVNLDLSRAVSVLAKVEYHISQAAAKTEDTPYDPLVMDLLEKLDDFKSAIFSAKSQIERRELD